MYIELGQGYLHDRDLENARRSFTKAMRIEDDSSEAYAGMAIIYQIEGEYEKAGGFFEKALKLDSSNSQVRNNYASFLYAQGQYEEALVQVKRATADTEYRNRPSAFINQAFIHEKMGDDTKAEQAFKRALRLDPDNATALINLSQNYYDREDYPQAKRLFDAYQSVSAHNAASLWLGVLIEVEYKNEDEVRRLGELLGSNFPYSKEFLEYRRLGVN